MQNINEFCKNYKELYELARKNGCFGVSFQTGLEVQMRTEDFFEHFGHCDYSTGPGYNARYTHRGVEFFTSMSRKEYDKYVNKHIECSDCGKLCDGESYYCFNCGHKLKEE